MKRNILSALGVALAALTLAACSSGGGGGGIGGSGIVAQGSITELGSIRVNGIRFDTGDASIIVDETSASENALRVGMVVTVVGRLDDDGVNAVADNVVYDDSLQGPVSVITTDVDGDTQSLSILGETVIADKALTVYEGAIGFDFDTIAVNDVVRVSGFRDAANALIATRLEWVGTFNPANPGATEIEISGLIAGLNGGSFMIGTLTVEYDDDTELPDGGLTESLFVEVEGVLQIGGSALADEIDLEDDGLPDDADEVEIEGVVSGFVSLSDFMVSSTVKVNAGAAEFEPDSLMSTIGNGTRVEIEGSLRDGVLMADEVKGRGGEVKIEAFVSGKSTMPETLTLDITSTIAVTVSTGPETDFKDDNGGDPLTHGTIMIGDYLSIRGFQNDDEVVASKVTRTEAEERIVLQGFVEGSSYDVPSGNGTLTVLGDVFGTDGFTEFERDGDSDDQDFADAAAFFSDAAIVNLTAVVKLIYELGGSETMGDGAVDEVEIEDDGDSDSGVGGDGDSD